jgi:hypothetical protein
LEDFYQKNYHQQRERNYLSRMGNTDRFGKLVFAFWRIYRNEAIQKGDIYKWLWFGYDDSVTEEKEILEANDNNMLRFSFSSGCIVTVAVKEEQGENICELVQEIPMDDESEQGYFYIECGKGWAFYMTNLKSILEGGIDLRNKNVRIQNLINA